MNTNINSVQSLIDFYSYFLSERCRRRYNRCSEDCRSNRDRRLREIDMRRSLIGVQRLMDILECRIQHIGNAQAISQCIAEVEEAAEARLARLVRLDVITEIRYRRCIQECKRQAGQCEDEIEFTGGGWEPGVIIDVDFEGGLTPFKPVLEICTQISGPCGDCERSLCGDFAWSFESDIPLDVTLVAATDPKKDARVIATSFQDNNQAILLIPNSIKLKGMEQFYLGFSSSVKPDSSVKVKIFRS